MELYSYQKKVLETIESDPSRSQLISMPTGTGKTITFLAAIKAEEKNCLILVHRNELLQQTYEKAFFLGFKKEEVSLITSQDKEDMNRLTIAMVPTLIRNLDMYSPDSIDMMVIDEAHHATANSYKQIMNHFRIHEDKKLLLGFTATPLRGDKKMLSSIFESHSFKMTLSEATQNGYICPVHGLKIDIGKSFEEIDSVKGDYDVVELDSVMNCEEINSLIAEKCGFNRKWPGIIFCTSVDHAQKIAKKLRENKVKAVSLSYKTPKKTLEKIFKWFDEGKIDVITNAVKLSEGFDHPSIETVILARPTRSPVLYKQMIGRGLRKSPNKYDCLVMEFCGNDKRMILWEDIDQNATFQCITAKERYTQEEAIKMYNNKIGSKNIIITDVLESAFSFYECRVRRLVKYRKLFRFIPFEEGFVLFKFIEAGIPGRSTKYMKGHNVFCCLCKWVEPLKSYIMWDEPDFLWKVECGRAIKECEDICHYYGEKQASGLGRWYPSDEEPITNRQKIFMRELLEKKVIPSISARKAEMVIEDFVIKKAINKFELKKEEKKIYEIFK